MNPANPLALLAWTPPLAGLVAVLAIVWLVGPTLAFGAVTPLAELWQRWLATALILVAAMAWILVTWFLALRRERKLEVGVAGTEQGNHAIDSRLKAGFQALRRRSRSPGAVLSMPWYAVIGPPGTGKTTAIRASGFHFVERDLVGAEAYKGVGGTRHCNWWLAEEAVLLDTAGRYTFSESASATDDAEWQHFLGTVKRFRPERPVNGVLVFFGLDQLSLLPEGQLAQVAASVSARTRELAQAFGLALPVYVVFTKLDRLAGFRELFEDISEGDSRRSLGVALDVVSDPRRVREAVENGVSDIVRRLELWTQAKVLKERNLQRTAKIISAPSQLLTVGSRIATVLERLAIDGGEGRQFRLRGLYLLSSVQEGNLFDRIAADLGGAFGIERAATDEIGHGSRALFVEGLFRDVVLPEAQLAGTDADVVRRKRLRRAAAVVAICVAGSMIALLSTAGYVANKGLVASFSTAAKRYHDVARRHRTTEDVSAQLDRLDALSEAISAAEHFEPDPPFLVWGFLYQGTMLSENAGDVYDLELGRIVGRHLRLSLEKGLRRPQASASTAQFEWLKAYLMLDQAHAARRDPAFLERVAADLWGQEYVAKPTLRDRLQGKLAVMLKRGLRSQTIDPQLVEQTRQRIAGGGTQALVGFVYRGMESQLAIPDGRDLTLGALLGLDGTRLFTFSPNWSANTVLPALYTRQGASAFALGLDSTLQSLASDSWVLDRYMPSPDILLGGQIRDEVANSYAREYILRWEALLQAVSIAPGQQSSALGLAAAHGTSPVVIFLRNVLPHIDLPTDDVPAQSGGDEAGEVAVTDPRKLINAHPGFARLSAAIRGDGTPSLDDFIAGLEKAATSLGMLEMTIGAGNEAMEPMRAYAMTAVMSSANAESFPSPLSKWYAALMGSALKKTQSIVRQGASAELVAKAGTACTTDVSAHYPFQRHATDELAQALFVELFAPNGTLDTALNTHLSKCVDTRNSPWRWAASCSLRGSLPADAPAQFERARRIRDAFFSGNDDRVQIELTLTPVVITSKNVQRVTIRVGQEVFEMGHGPPRKKTLVWQANAENGMPIEIAFDPLPGAGNPAKTLVEGPWSLLRWLDGAFPRQVQPGGGIELEVAADGYRATVKLESRRLESLLADADWRNFRCPM